MYFYLLNKLDFNSSMIIEINWASIRRSFQREISSSTNNNPDRCKPMISYGGPKGVDKSRCLSNWCQHESSPEDKMTSTFGFSFATLREFTVEWRKFIASNVLGSGGRASTREHTKRLQRFPVELNTTTIWCEKVCSPTAEMFWVARFMSDRRCLCQRNRARSAKMFIGKAF